MYSGIYRIRDRDSDSSGKGKYLREESGDPVVYPTGNEDNRNDFFCFSAETVGIEIWEKSFAVYPEVLPFW